LVNKKWLSWFEMAYLWSDNTFTWSEVFIFINAVNAVRGGGGPYWRTDPNIKSNISKVVNEKDLETFVKVICHVNGKDFTNKKKKVN
jgi:hypothetical protein